MHFIVLTVLVASTFLSNSIQHLVCIRSANVMQLHNLEERSFGLDSVAASRVMDVTCGPALGANFNNHSKPSRVGMNA